MKRYRPLAELFLGIVLCMTAHLLILHFFFKGRTDGFHYAMPELYAYFSIVAVLILLLLIKMKKSNLDSVGNTFMLLTALQMGFAYLLLRPVLAIATPGNTFERANFFAVFAIFLIVETTVSVRLLLREDGANF